VRLNAEGFRMLAAKLADAILSSSRMTLIDWRGRRHEIGPPDAPYVGALEIRSAAAARRIALDPQIAVGESFVDGDLVVAEGDLVDIITAILKELAAGRAPARLKLRSHLAYLLHPLRQLNSPSAARRHIAYHYDLDWDFYRLWLDAEGHYSCAYFASPNATLEEAQEEKARRIAKKLALRPGDRVLDIGSGWGAMALHLARNYDVEVVGISLSREQIAVAEKRAAAEGLSGRIRFRYDDYREHEGRYDRIVSIGMLEHVGAPNLEDYFHVVRKNLTDDGVALIHTIGRVGPPAATAAWVDKRIFPGGFLPAMSEVSAAVERSRLFSTDIEVLRLHYALTLREWRRRFNAHRAEIEKRYDERFCRMWEFYLVISEASFLAGQHVNFQFQLARSLEALPLTRDYLYASPTPAPAAVPVAARQPTPLMARAKETASAYGRMKNGSGSEPHPGGPG
jgi:cyclopropane-fatty-acyl-phospholipid synthase